MLDDFLSNYGWIVLLSIFILPFFALLIVMIFAKKRCEHSIKDGVCTKCGAKTKYRPSWFNGDQRFISQESEEDP